MKYFQSYKDTFRNILTAYIAAPRLHAKWLNTLSYLENCGARKIARREHPQEVSKEILKHASEEFRHAFYLKQQIGTKLGIFLPSYQKEMLVGSHETLCYLNRLEISICRLLKKEIPNICTEELRKYSYQLVTYAIELRASELYPIYQELLIEAGSPISVRSILLEEKEHLKEMEEGLEKLVNGYAYLDRICSFEGQICEKWLRSLVSELINMP